MEVGKGLRAVVIAGVCFASPGLLSANLVISTFDTDMDGWTSDSPGEVTWEAAGGNPGGFLLFDDGGESGCDLIAPDKFLGDWSSLDGTGTIEYDHKVVSVGGGGHFIPYYVYLHSPNSHAIWTGDTPTGPTDWVHVVVPIEESQWVVDRGTWDELLSNVTKLFIKIELFDNDGANYDEFAGVDNVALVPAPGAVVLGTIGLCAVGGYIRRRRR